ncbi:MAG: PilZ domain-containing protein [Candidatus Omnitrophica bacterium]|nr:PilZ domain-containing protein [Candidatus Omnitrophota bacterium]
MNKKKYDKRIRVIALLSREEVEFIDKLGLDSHFSTGLKLSRVDIVSSLVNAAKALGVSAEGVRSKKELIERIIYTASTQLERRRYPRLKKELKIDFRNMDSLETYKEATTNDIGLGGFSFSVEYEICLNVGQVVEITISDPKDKQKTVKAIGRVVWIKEMNNQHDKEIGVMLTHIKNYTESDFPTSFIKEEEEKPGVETEGGSDE